MAKDKIAKQDMVKVGDVYGELTVIERDYEREELDRLKKRYKKYFKCKCSCGKETTVLAYQLPYQWYFSLTVFSLIILIILFRC